MEILDNGAMAALGAIDGFAAQVDTEQHISAYMGALHSRLSEEFDVWVDTIARAAPARYWHVYEEGMVGSQPGRLWVHQLQGRGSTRIASVRYLPSKVPVKVNKALLEPGKTGKTVKEDEHVFTWKAPVIEFALPVTIKPKNGNWLTFAVRGKVYFTNKTIEATPGRKYGGSFNGSLAAFYGGRAPSLALAIDKNELRGGEMPAGTITRQAMKKFNISTRAFDAGKTKAEAKVMRKTAKYLGLARKSVSEKDLWG